MQNPKLKDSNIIEAIPQIGECPIGCEECFYNGGRFFRTLEEPLLPTAEEAEGKIVRVNTGHDSNIQRKLVLEKTAGYRLKFFNTSIPRFDFPGPVAFTCNGKKLLLVEPTSNLMVVRIRVSTWNFKEVDRAVEHYLARHKIPVLLTFMRYYDVSKIRNKENYEKKEHILNEYWCLKPEAILRVLERYKGRGVRMCGTPVSSFCVDCRNCEFLYWDCLRRMRN